MQPRLLVISIYSMLLFTGGVRALCLLPCPSAHSSGCGTSCSAVVEMPKGLRGLAGQSFVLGSLPISSSDVHIYVSGLELIPEADFHVAGQTVTFLRSLAVGNTGATLVRYESQFAPGNSAVCPALDVTDLVARTALTRAALADGSDAPTSSANALRTPSDLPEKRTQDRSLQLLVHTLNTQSVESHHKVGKAKRRFGAIAQGVDGQGDVLLEPRYSILGGGPAMTGLPGSERGITAEPKSLQMLRQSLTKPGVQ